MVWPFKQRIFVEVWPARGGRVHGLWFRFTAGAKKVWLPTVDLADGEMHDCMKAWDDSVYAGRKFPGKLDEPYLRRCVFSAALRERASQLMLLSGSCTTAGPQTPTQEEFLRAACAAAVKAVDLMPTALCFYHLGQTLEQAGKMGEAKAAFRKFLEEHARPTVPLEELKNDEEYQQIVANAVADARSKLGLLDA